ncbi:hypothetical protein ANOBCDAF_00711 [Pleomorphomonas sp. T1.2MG-36]|nr:hypothetical protein ANOBCDAF_00711 [Pleomorphomonas sp. T1.2MG-36]
MPWDRMNWTRTCHDATIRAVVSSPPRRRFLARGMRRYSGISAPAQQPPAQRQVPRDVLVFDEKLDLVARALPGAHNWVKRASGYSPAGHIATSLPLIDAKGLSQMEMDIPVCPVHPLRPARGYRELRMT